MSETPAETPGRAFARFVDEDAGEVSLPGYLGATPSIVSAGDLFSYDAAYSGEVLAEEGRFEEASADDARSPNESLTKAELGELVGVNSDDYSKDELVTLADDRARMYPPVPGPAADPVEQETPIPGQDVHDPDADRGEGDDGDAGDGGEDGAQ